MEDVQLLQIAFEQVGGHLRLLIGVADASGFDVLEEDSAQLIHRLRIYLERLLQEPHALELTDPIGHGVDRDLGRRIDADADTHNAEIFGRNLKGDKGICDGVECRIVGAVTAVDEFDVVTSGGPDHLAVEERICRARRFDRVGYRAAETRDKGRGASMRLVDRCFEYHRTLDDPPRRDDPDAGLHFLEFLFAEDLGGQGGQRGGLRLRRPVSGDPRDVGTVQVVDMVDLVPEREKGRYDGARTGAEYDF